MVLIGTNETCLLKGTIPNTECLTCKIHSTIDYSIFTKYTSLTFIPLFPVGNTVYIKCNNCSKEINFEDLDENTKIKLIDENKKTNQRRPIWLFSGIIILVCFIIFYFFSLYQTDNETKALVKAPAFGDIYNIKSSNGYYSSMRIDKVTKDSVYATQNDYRVYLQSEVEEINKTENYTNRKNNYSKKDLLKLYDNDDIFSVIRK
ncbi:zinc ribbon family protein [Flavobacterium sp. 1]|nr:zinc ribbon family protein [Flavobacterium sp. 1]